MGIHRTLAASIGVLCVVACASLVGTASAATPDWMQCTHVNVAVSGAAPGTPGWTIYGELCRRRGATPTTVQLLVHGATYTHAYWDFPVNPDRHSYVRAAAAAGYATFNVDRLSVGASSRPSSAEVHINTTVDTLSEVITQLRAGRIGGVAFRKVVWVGHSFGSFLGWIEASRHHDVDAFVLTGMVHHIKPSALTLLTFVPAALDSPTRFGALDPGYLTMADSNRAQLFYYPPTTDPAVVARDNQIKDTITATEFSEAFPVLANPDPATSVSQQIGVPTLVLMGTRDATFCGDPDGLDCSTAALRAHEQPFYSPAARLTVATVPETGHDLTLHETAPASAAISLAWIATTLR